MKKIIIIIFLFSNLTSIRAQNWKSTDRESPTVDMFVGQTFGSGISFGLFCRNIFWENRAGFYFMTHYFNTAWAPSTSGDTHFNSQFGWRQKVDTSIRQIKPWGMTFGTTFNLVDIFGWEDTGLSLLLGTGWVTTQSQTEYTSTRFYNNQYLNPTTQTVALLNKTVRPTFETLINWDIFKTGSASLSITGGWNFRMGGVLGGAIGIRQ